MHIEHLLAFLTVYEQGSINKASKVLNLQQQRLSKIIAVLEKDLNCTLLERSSRGIQLTPKGKIALPIIYDLAKNFDKLKQSLAESVDENLSGTLVIHLPVNDGIGDILNTDILENFIAAYPSVHLTFDEMTSKQVIDSIDASPKDIGFIIRAFSHFNTPMDLPAHLSYIPLQRSKICALAGQNTLYAQKYKSCSLKSLQKESCAIYSPNNTYPPMISKLYESLGGISLKYIVNSQKTLYKILQNGQAITLGIQRSLPYLTENHLVEIPLKESIVIEMGIVFDPKFKNNRLISTFIQFILKAYTITDFA